MGIVYLTLDNGVAFASFLRHGVDSTGLMLARHS